MCQRRAAENGTGPFADTETRKRNLARQHSRV